MKIYTSHLFRKLLKIKVLLLLLILPTLLQAQSNQRIIPSPVQYKTMEGEFIIDKNSVLLTGEPAAKHSATFLNQYLQAQKLDPLRGSKKPEKNTINLKIDSKIAKQKEGYILTVTPKQITITGHDEAGLFYGVQSLIQLIQPQGKTAKVDVVWIEDVPRFGYRGMHLDVSRHMFPVEFIKKYIDMLAFYKFNTFHWHLTDDQGWRLEIKKYPKLQSVSAYRDETLIGHKKELPHTYDGKRYGGYYTQDEVRDIVRYAQERYVTIIPEIEMPGHASAVLAAYPNLGCTGGPYEVAKFWGIFDEVFCAGNDESFHFLTDVLDEVMELFPSTYIHAGGDECPKVRWKACPKCQNRIAKEGLKDEDELQSYFMKRIEAHLLKHGRKLIGWDEILEGGLSHSATVMSWRGEDGAIQAAKQGNEAIMIPESHVYFDYYQSLNPDEPLASTGFTPLEKVYSYEPIPKELSAEETKYIKGVQGAVWSEYLTTPQHAEYMIFPRMLAVAEIAWSPKRTKDYSNFLARVDHHQSMLKTLSINSFPYYDEIQWEVTDNKLIMTSTRPEHQIYYTIDGSNPGLKTMQYRGPIPIKSGIIKAQLFEDGKPVGRLLTKEFKTSKATGKTVTLLSKPVASFATNPQVLVNGVEGTTRYNDKQWMAFSGEDFEAIIDLGSIQKISTVGANILKYHWQRMWAPTELVFSTSLNGTDFVEVARETDFPVNGINHVRKNIPETEARYIKVFAKNKGIVLPGEYGAGSKASLLIDEIFID